MPTLVESWRTFLIESLGKEKAINDIQQLLGGSKGDLSRIFEGQFPSKDVQRETYNRFRSALRKSTLESAPIVDNTEQKPLQEELNAYLESEVTTFAAALFNEDQTDIHPDIKDAIGADTYDKLVNKFGQEKLMALFLQSTLMYNSQILVAQHETYINTTYPAKLSIITLDSSPEIEGKHQHLHDRLPLLALYGNTVSYMYQDIEIRDDGAYDVPRTVSFNIDSNHLDSITTLFPKSIEKIEPLSPNALNTIKENINKNQENKLVNGFPAPTFEPRLVTLQGAIQFSGFNYNLFTHMQGFALGINEYNVNADYRQLNALQKELTDVITNLQQFRDSRWGDDPRIGDIKEALDSLREIYDTTQLHMDHMLKNPTANYDEDVKRLLQITTNSITTSLNNNIVNKPSIKESYSIFEKLMNMIINWMNKTNESTIERTIKPLFKSTVLVDAGTTPTLSQDHTYSPIEQDVDNEDEEEEEDRSNKSGYH